MTEVHQCELKKLSATDFLFFLLSVPPKADLFNIWRDDYMLTPQEAAQEVGNTLLYAVTLISVISEGWRWLSVLPTVM